MVVADLYFIVLIFERLYFSNYLLVDEIITFLANVKWENGF